MGDGRILGMRIFYCGSQYADWVDRNCGNCHREGKCQLRAALVAAFWDDGRVTDDVARRLGYAGHERNYGWRCGELEPVETEEAYARRSIPERRKLASLWLRLWRGAKFTWELWNPWWGPKQDIYGSMERISLWTAWSVAWRIHHDDRQSR